MTTVEKFSSRLLKASVSVESFFCRHLNTIMVVLGAAVLLTGLDQLSHAGGAVTSFSEANYDASLVRGAVGNIFRLIEGPFGALIMVVAGLGAIVAAAMGAYRGALALVVVAVGAFILRALVSLFFGTTFSAFNGTAAGA